MPIRAAQRLGSQDGCFPLSTLIIPMGIEIDLIECHRSGKRLWLEQQTWRVRSHVTIYCAKSGEMEVRPRVFSARQSVTPQSRVLDERALACP